MKCAFCGKEIAGTVGRTQRCGQCPGACGKIHCPHCGYANPLIPNFLKRFIKPEDDKKE